MATFEECAAASDAAGRDVEASEIDAALAKYGATARTELEEKFTILYVGLEHSGFRDPELADVLDAMHIAITVMKHQEANG